MADTTRSVCNFFRSDALADLVIQACNNLSICDVKKMGKCYLRYPGLDLEGLLRLCISIDGSSSGHAQLDNRSH